MRTIKATVKYEGNDVYTVQINDEFAIMSLLKYEWCGFSALEALRHANVALNNIGLEAVLDDVKVRWLND